MRKVAILGIGQTKVGEHWDKSLQELAAEAILVALDEAKLSSVEGLFVGNMLSGSLNHQEHLGAMIADWIGLKDIEIAKFEAACGSGGAAFRAGVIAVASCELESVLVVGVEKMTDSKMSETTTALATAADADWESTQGLSFVGINALIMQRYMYEYGWKHNDFAPFPMVAHENAALNPYARLRSPISEEDYNKARMIADPINVLDASPIGDGAAAVVIVPASKVHHHANKTIIVAGSDSTTDTIALHDRKDPLWLSAAYKSARKVYSQACVQPQDIDVFEVHDAFSIMSALSLEACGFAERGQAPRLALEGEISLTGRIPITTFGGLKARGHPVGATGVYQIVELVRQLRGEAGKNQVDGAKVGLTQNIGGSGATIISHILMTQP